MTRIDGRMTVAVADIIIIAELWLWEGRSGWKTKSRCRYLD